MHLEVSARIGAMIVQVAASAGVPTDELTTATGFDPSVARDPDARIPLELEEALWGEASSRSHDEAFGLHAAQGLRPGALDVFDYAVRTAPTLRGAIDRLVRYNRLVHDTAIYTLIDRDDRLRIEHSFRQAGRNPCIHASEFTLASFIVIGGQLSGSPVRPRLVEFRHASPASTSAHELLFGTRPRFSAAVNAIELDHATLERPVVGSDPALSAVIERHADALLASREEPVASTSQRVRRLLVTMLREGEASLSTVSKRLGMSARSLQRRLAAEGVSFDVVLDELRRELALRYLEDRKVAISEVAYLTGYSEPSAFHRAFKRWTGATPSDARRRAA